MGRRLSLPTNDDTREAAGMNEGGFRTDVVRDLRRVIDKNSPV
jgi:hypothetical protein